MWELLPDLILEDIFKMLSMQERYYASLTCKNWNQVFLSSRVWHRFILKENTLTRNKFNYYMGYEKFIDHYRTRICFNKVCRNFRSIIIKPIANFFNLYEFTRLLSEFVEFFTDQNPLHNVRYLEFTFACHLAYWGTQEVIGTGGKLLDSIMRLMGNLPGLKHLSLTNLLLDNHEAIYLLDSVAYNCVETLKRLELINCTKMQCPIFAVGVFIALDELKISPQHLSDDIVVLLGNTSLKNMYIIQTEYTEFAKPVSKEAWKECCLHAPQLNVHLVIDGPVRNSEVIWQPRAPVMSIIYKSPYIPVSSESVLTACEYYKKYLKIYGHMTIPKFHVSKYFHERADSALVLLCHHCPLIQRLFVRERISTATVLLIAHSASNLKNFYVRRNAVVKKCDWPQSPEWTGDFYLWLRTTAASYEDTDKEVSQLIRQNFHMLHDQKFKLISNYEIS